VVLILLYIEPAAERATWGVEEISSSRERRVPG
jgi:hypothetical protein